VVRPIYAFIVQTVDGYYEGLNGEFDWPNVDDEFNEFAIAQVNDTDMLLFGRKTYEGMAGYWPTDAAVAEDPLVAPLMNDIPKVVFSTTLETADWNNTRLVRNNVVEEVRELKDQPGKQLAIFGSSELTANLLQLGLVDELRIMIHPIILGAGHSLLRTLGDRVPVELVDSRIFASGNVLLNYRPKPAVAEA
jgi:dihydrofolate reductase